MDIFRLEYATYVFYEVVPYFPITIKLVVLPMIIGCLIGVGNAIVQFFGVPVLSFCSRMYVTIFRALPNMIALYLLYYSVPMLLSLMADEYGLEIPMAWFSAFSVAVVVFSLHVGAYLTEIFRSAFLSVGQGQLEAAQSVGMNRYQCFRHVLFPQAIPFAVPMIGTQCLMLLKSTTLVFAISVMDMFGAGKLLCDYNSRYFETFLILAVMYWFLSFVLQRCFVFAEKKLALTA